MDVNSECYNLHCGLQILVGVYDLDFFCLWKSGYIFVFFATNNFHQRPVLYWQKQDDW